MVVVEAAVEAAGVAAGEAAVEAAGVLTVVAVWRLRAV